MNKSLFFCTGLPKSGTTFLQRTLTLHDEVYCPAEHNLNALSKNINNLLDQYQGLLQLIDTRTGGQGVAPVGSATKNNIFRCTVEQLLYESAGAKKIVGANDNAIVNDLASYNQIFDRPKLIVIFRNPIDAAISAWHHNSRLAIEENNQQHVNIMERHGGFDGWLKFYAQLFETTVQNYFDFRSENPNTIYLRYEDLKNNKKESLRSLFGFLGAATSDDILADIANKSSIEAMAETSIKKEFFRSGSTSMGEGVVSRELRDQVSGIAAGALEQLGYA